MQDRALVNNAAMKTLAVLYPDISKTSWLFTDNEKKSKLKMELAIVIDYGENFVKATYDLEGDGPLILHCFEIIDTLCNAIKSLDNHSLNAEAVSNDLSRGSVTCKKSSIEYARTCVHLF